ncbi:MAG: Uncharacterised protein [Methanobacteriota archaeon]|nr:MAG: Uncharacterised protein [Euryarchaeota archaeon]|tara:strand:- start:5524 stop:9567 length:4044 start_codon:yes stop_codon:yes gene_type:complete
MSEQGARDVHDPLIGLDIKRLDKEMDSYQNWLDERTEEAYQIAEQMRSLGFDHTTEVEIPRASDLASRTEKLLIHHLEGEEVADDIRAFLSEHDRETTSIKMAQMVAKRLRDKGHELSKCIDVGIRVGLAILTEAVLVAPLEGISEVRLLSNLDGSQFLSVHFAGPIRAAGGTAQALAVLIADMIRRELGVDAYRPTDPEVERVKEEFGLYRGNLQYKPPPEEIETIVRACPVMVNGESTESIECAGYGRVRNIDEARIRGGVLLVIGEGLCLKAPKIQKHTERLNVAGWEFITAFANKGKEDENDENQSSFKSNKVPPIDKFMKDIIAGRPVFGGPLQPGGFRLRYGRARPSGLAAGSCNPASMAAMDDFITVGTQMKIERPGKACAITPCDIAEGPWVILRDGTFLRIDDEKEYRELKPKVKSIWDNGELLLGYGEFMENNKKLVPAGYSQDWWASDLIDALDSEQAVEDFCRMSSIQRSEFPEGVPGKPLNSNTDYDSRFHIRRTWRDKLISLKLPWQSCKEISLRFSTSLPYPHNPWWLDLPIEWLPPLIKIIDEAIIEDNCLRFIDGVKNWKSSEMDKLLPEEESALDAGSMPGYSMEIGEKIFSDSVNNSWILRIHGLAKGAALMLGIAHHHDGDDLVLTEGWQSLIDGLGFSIDRKKALRIEDTTKLVETRIQQLRNAADILEAEKTRLSALENKRSTVRIAAETDARQRGLGISETDEIGRAAAANVPDAGPKDSEKYLQAQLLEEEHSVDGTLWVVRNTSKLRWEHSAPVRIGCRMGRPEKAAPREKTFTHSLFPIENTGGNQRLLANAEQQKEIRVQLGARFCTVCERKSPMIRCHHRNVDEYGADLPGQVCNGRTELRENPDNKNARRRGEFQTINLSKLIEDARLRLGIDRIPKQVKCAKKLMSKNQTPEAIEKGLLRAKHGLPVFRDGTVRFDMSDVPVTHFTPEEIGVEWQQLKHLGYARDCFGEELNSNSQMLELYPQDFIIAEKATDYFVRAAQFVDDLLVKFYGAEPYYHVEKPEDLVGHLICALAPHTSGGVLSRIIGWTKSSGGYAHPLFHASKRRNCDGDEDAIMLLMDGLLNFSREILPSNRGGQMDAPLVLTTRLNPTEVDKEALNVDSAWFYERWFYEATLDQPHPKELAEKMDFVERRIGSVAAIRGLGYTHSTKLIDQGPALSAYKTLESMIDKMNGQLGLGHRLRGVNVRTVASSVIRSHFLPDLRGNLVAFTRQKVRCLKCGHSYRRMPLAGKCIQNKALGGRGMANFGVKKSEGDLCNGNLALTVTEGAVRKYIKVTKHVMATYGVDNYTRQNVEWLAESADSLFSNDRAKQMSLSDFI